MFNKTMATNNISDTPSLNIIGAGTIIEGDITTNRDMRIDGTVTGSINIKGKLVVGPSGSIDGEVICQNADIQGTLKAKIEVSELLSLKSSAKLTGDIVTNKIAIEPGAVFTGSCSMGNGQIIKEAKVEETGKQQSQKAAQQLR